MKGFMFSPSEKMNPVSSFWCLESRKDRFFTLSLRGNLLGRSNLGSGINGESTNAECRRSAIPGRIAEGRAAYPAVNQLLPHLHEQRHGSDSNPFSVPLCLLSKRMLERFYGNGSFPRI